MTDTEAKAHTFFDPSGGDRFEVTRRGYDRLAVDRHLRQLEKNFTRSKAENDRSTERIRILEDQVSTLRKELVAVALRAILDPAEPGKRPLITVEIIKTDEKKDGEIQAYVGNASDFTALSANDVALRNITPENVGQIDGNPLAVLPGTLEEKRDAIVGFLRAWTKGQYVGQVNR